jgi:peptide/nickel transport system substrate-binding protein
MSTNDRHERMMDDYSYHLYEEVRSGRMTRRAFMQRAAVMGISATAVSTILAACGSSAPSPTKPSSAAALVPERGGTLQLGTFGAGGALEPWISYASGAVIAFQLAAEYLCTQNSAHQLIPQLATSWAPVAGNAGEWQFNIRKGVRFQNGDPLTASDVAATFNTIVNPNFGSGALSGFQGILSPGAIEEVGDYTVRFHLDRPFVGFPYLLTPSNYNAVILPKNYKMGTFVNGRSGTGPFVMTSYRPAIGAAFTRNNSYWDKPKPYLDGANLQFYSDEAPIFLALESGSLDVFDSMPYSGSQPIFANPQLQVLTAKATTWRAVHMRVTDKPWTDYRVRQALAYTVNRRGAVAALLGGHGELGNDNAFAPIYPSTPSVTELPQRDQDLSKAKALLAAAGYSRGFSATLTTEDFLEIPDYVTLIKSEAAKVGIDITLNVETQTTYYGSGSNQPWLDVPFGCVDWDTRPDAGQNSEPAFACNGVWNSAHWCNPTWTSTMMAYDGELDVQRQKQLALTACRIQQEATPAIIAYWIDGLTGAKKTVHGYDTGARYFADVWMS